MTAARAVGAGLLCAVLAAAMLVVVTVSVSSAACLPTPTPDVASGTPSPSGGSRQQQITNARLIDQVAVELGLPGIATKAALMMALQESDALNLASRANRESLRYPHDGVASGDHSSVGIAQQQDNWGGIAERMNVATSIAMFFTGGSPTPDGYAEPGLVDIPGWVELPLTEAVQRVQQSAYPDAYARHDRAAEVLAHQAGINLHRAGDPYGSGAGGSPGAWTPTADPACCPTGAAAPGSWLFPAGPISSRYGPRGTHGEFHTGTDFAVPIGTPVLAANSGIVVTVGGPIATSYGLWIVIDHGTDANNQRIETLHAHLDTVNVAIGTPVTGGQVIATSGNRGRSTGPHLHYEIHLNGAHTDPEQFHASQHGTSNTTDPGTGGYCHAPSAPLGR